MKIAIGADHGGFGLKEILKEKLQGQGHTVIDCGTHDENSCHYPIYAKAVCKEIQNGNAERGILCCGTGIGMSIAANKMRGIRAAVCSDAYSVKFTRLHNDSQVLCLGARVIEPALAEELTEIFLSTETEGGRHAERIAMIAKIEEESRK